MPDPNLALPGGLGAERGTARADFDEHPTSAPAHLGDHPGWSAGRRRLIGAIRAGLAAAVGASEDPWAAGTGALVLPSGQLLMQLAQQALLYLRQRRF